MQTETLILAASQIASGIVNTEFSKGPLTPQAIENIATTAVLVANAIEDAARASMRTR
jgi:hypothetical protein